MTRDGDQVLGPEDDAVWEPVTGNYRPAPSPLYPAHCQYRRPIVDELKKDMESDYFYRKCVAGKESAREKKIKKLEDELAKAREIIEGKHLSTTGGGRMKLLKVTLKGEGRPYIVHIPFDKIVEIRTQAGSENVYCKVNGVEVKENYYDIITLLEAADAHE